MAYTSRHRGRREPLLTTFLYSTTYRGVLVCVLAFCVCVAGAAWALRGSAPVRRIYLWNQPGALYHVRSDGEVVPTGGTDQTKPPPAPPVVAHANLLDRQYHITAEFGSYPEGGAHYGLDLDAWTGTTVHAPVGGTVTEVQRGCTVGDLSCGK